MCVCVHACVCACVLVLFPPPTTQHTHTHFYLCMGVHVCECSFAIFPQAFVCSFFSFFPLFSPFCFLCLSFFLLFVVVWFVRHMLQVWPCVHYHRGFPACSWRWRWTENLRASWREQPLWPTPPTCPWLPERPPSTQVCPSVFFCTCLCRLSLFPPTPHHSPPISPPLSPPALAVCISVSISLWICVCLFVCLCLSVSLCLCLCLSPPPTLPPPLSPSLPPPLSLLLSPSLSLSLCPLSLSRCMYCSVWQDVKIQ